MKLRIMEIKMNMRKMLSKRFLSVLCIALMLVASVTTTYASKLQDAQQAKDEAQKKLDEVKK